MSISVKMPTRESPNINVTTTYNVANHIGYSVKIQQGPVREQNVIMFNLPYEVA